MSAIGRKAAPRLRQARASTRVLLCGKRARKVIRGVQRERMTFLDAAALLDLYRRVLEIERRSASGIIIEAGCARGGSAIVMSSAKKMARPLHVYDTFSAIPPPSAEDGPDVHERYEVIADGRAGPDYYGYDRDLLGQVRRSFAGYGMETEPHAVRLIPGLFEDTLSVDQPVALRTSTATGTSRR